MSMTISSGLLSGARQVSSPNCDAREDDTDISLLVVHGISLPPGQFGGPYIDQLFCNRLNPEDDPYFRDIAHLKVSSHLLIRRDGEVVQYVPFQKRAWHAGVSSFNGREKCNDFSIGIELEGEDETPYTDIQYQALAQTAAVLIKEYPALSAGSIAGHSDIAPGRKTDPGSAFDWAYFNRLLASYSENS